MSGPATSQNREGLRPLTSLQKSMVLASLRAPRSGSYVLQEVCQVAGELDLALLKRAWCLVARRHPALCTSIVAGPGDQLWQQVNEKLEIPWQELDWTGLAPDITEEKLAVFLREDWERGFNFDHGIPARFTLLRNSVRSSNLIWTVHHALLDGRSCLIVWQELFAFYDGFLHGTEVRLAAPTTFPQYLDWLQRQDFSRAERYWRQYFAGLSETTDYVVDRIHPAALQSAAFDAEGFAKEGVRLSEKLTEELWNFARCHEISVNTLVQGAWALLLSRYSGRADVVFGVTRAGRSSMPDAEAVVGVLINTLPFRITVLPDTPLLAWLKQIRQQWLDMRQYEHTPLERVWEWSGLPPGMPPFDSLLVYDHEPPEQTLQKLGGDWRWRTLRRVQRTDSPLTLAAYGKPVLSLEIVYDMRLFRSATVTAMAGHLRTLLQSFITQPDCPLATLKMLAGREEKCLVQEWNQTEVAFPRNLCAHQLFEQQARRTPEKTALDSPQGPIRYHELNQRANQLARSLRDRNAGPEDLIAICLDRSPEAVIAVLAVLKAGAAFLPLDPGLPSARLASMLKDARPKVVLARELDFEKLKSSGCEVVSLDRLQGEIANQPSEDFSGIATPENASYAIYTSGSTGLPKAVVVTHRSLVNHTLAASRVYGISDADRRLQFASLGTDVFIAEVFNYLCCGATLVFGLNRNENSVREFLRFLDEQRITITGIPSTWWNEWVTAMSDDRLALPSSLRAAIIGMERVNPAAFLDWKRVVGNRIRWFNAYGPTETTPTAAIYEAGSSEWERGSFVPIGRPIANTTAYVLDSAGNPAPVGVPGELYIGGDGVARGYLNSPDLTSERFLPDTFSASPGGRLFRTGDLVFYLPDGNLVFLGRADRQVKIRGFRVELEEIEAVLAQHPAVSQCVVVVDPRQGQDSLVAYLTPANRPAPAPDELRRHLSRFLPDHMLPAAFVNLPEMPLTSSGKIDRLSLPRSEQQRLSPKRAFREPSTQTEKRLAALWREVLDIAPVGATDNFFELGGDSLRATRLITLIYREFGRELPLAAVLRSPTIARLASALELDGCAASLQDRNSRAPCHGIAAIQPSGSSPVFYCVHGFAVFRHLARRLDRDQPILGIAPVDPFELPVPYHLDDFTSRYLATLRAAQPRGPYVLGGWCNAGVIAYEMAQQLWAQGECVPLLVLFDAVNPAAAPGYMEWRSLSGRLRFQLDRLRTLKAGDYGTYAEERIRTIINGIWERTWRTRYRLHRVMERPLPSRLVDLAQIEILILRNYHPRPYPGRVLLFRCEQRSAMRYMDSTYGWGELVKGGLEIIDLPGSHTDMFDEPVVSSVAQELEARLRSALAAPPDESVGAATSP